MRDKQRYITRCIRQPGNAIDQPKPNMSAHRILKSTTSNQIMCATCASTQTSRCAADRGSVLLTGIVTHHSPAMGSRFKGLLPLAAGGLSNFDSSKRIDILEYLVDRLLVWRSLHARCA